MDPNRRHQSPHGGSRSRGRTPAGSNAGDDVPGMRGGEGPVVMDVRTRSVSHTRYADPVFLPPSEEEAVFFYYGFPSQPRLVGRTSAAEQPWENIDDQMKRQKAEQRAGKRRQSTFFSPRSLTPAPIGIHAIRYNWDLRMYYKFASTLHPLPWRSIDLLRMIPSDCDTEKVEWYTGTVVAWVALQHADTPWKVVAQVLTRCRRVLDVAGLHDVDIQLRMSPDVSLADEHIQPVEKSSSSSSTSVWSPTPLAPPPPNFVMRWMDGVYPFTTAIGQPLFPANSPTIQGSLGLFCWPSMTNSTVGARPAEMYVITCRHVGMAGQKNTHFNQINQSVSGNEEGEAHSHSDPNTHGIGIAAQETAEIFFETLDRRLSVLASDIKSTSGEEKQMLEAELSLDTKVAKSLSPFKDADARKIGRVVYSPTIDVDSGPEPEIKWTRDICLVEIDKSKVPDGPMNTPWPANIVDLRLHKEGLDHLEKFLHSFKQEIKPGGPKPIRFNRPKDGLLKLSGIIPVEEILRLPGPSIDKHGDNCIVVGKNGPETGLTWGWASEMMSVHRTPFDDDTGFFSFEWAIYGIGKKGALDDPQRFSARGDSGSAVFGIDGRLGGFLTSGTNPVLGLSVDITYVTPAAFVLANIKKALGRKVSF